MVRMPETKTGMAAATLGVLGLVGVVLPLAFIGAVTLAVSHAFPADDFGPTTIAGPVDARTVYADLVDVADGDDRRGSGEQYRCRLVALRADSEHPRAYRCVVPGHGAGDLGYRVTIRSAHGSCWRARGDAPPLDGCITQTVESGAFVD